MDCEFFTTIMSGNTPGNLPGSSKTEPRTVNPKKNRRRHSALSLATPPSFSVSLTANPWSTFKLLKACNFCRRRKIKCVMSQLNSTCDYCRNHGIDCQFDHKKLNIKTGVVEPKISNDEKVYREELKEFTPCVDGELFGQLDLFCQKCIAVAAGKLPCTPEMFVDLEEWSLPRLSCFFLLPLRVPVPDEVLVAGLRALGKVDDISDSLLATAMTIDAWAALTHERKVVMDPLLLLRFHLFIVEKYTESFAHYFLYVGYFLYKLLWLKECDMDDNTKRNELVRLEFDMLLWPARLSQYFSVVTDELEASKEAFMLHIVHNCLLCYYYTVNVNSPLGRLTSISAVPGLYNFIAGMARSNFRMDASLVNLWNILLDCQVVVADCLYQLNETMDFGEFKFCLASFKQQTVENRPMVAGVQQKVQELLDSESIYEDPSAESDGTTVFWVFRDVRSMSLQMYIDTMRSNSV